VKGGAENRKKTIVAGTLGAGALVAVIILYNSLFGGTAAPPPAPTPVATTTPSAKKSSSSTNAAQSSANGSLGAAPGVTAKVMASTSSSLDPTLDESAMLRTENLVYSGNGRNIFSTTYTAPVDIPQNAPKARVGSVVQQPPPEPTGPPPPPPINLRFFGTATRANGVKQAFLLNGEDVYLAAAGDIVARKYKIVSIGTVNIQVEDLLNSNTQTLPLIN
jgi:hypothetical protein